MRTHFAVCSLLIFAVHFQLAFAMMPNLLDEKSEETLEGDHRELEIANIAGDKHKSFWDTRYAVNTLKVMHQVIELVTMGPLFLCATGCRMAYDYAMNPAEAEGVPAESDKVATILLHGKGANDSQYIISKKFLSGPVFSFNYFKDKNGKTCYLSNSDDLDLMQAAQVVREKINEISRRHGIKKFNLVGHSLGGILAMIYAEKFSEEDEIEVRKVVTIHSPLKGTPSISFIRKYSYGFVSLRQKLYDQMQAPDGCFATAGRTIRVGLVPVQRKLYAHRQTPEECLTRARYEAIASVHRGRRQYFHINGELDKIVPKSHGVLETDLCPNRVFLHAHYGASLDPRVWRQIDRWLVEEIVDRDESQLEITDYPACEPLD